MSETILYLVRHGATDYNERQPIVLQGHGIDGPLNANGEKQARAVAELLRSRPISALYCSPMLRARLTAQVIAQHHPLEPQQIAQLHEVNVGDWEGMSWEEIQRDDAEWYERFLNDPYVPYRGGESYGDVLERVRPVLDSLLERHPGEQIAVVAHNVVNRVYLTELLGLHLQKSRSVRQQNCCVNVIRRAGTTVELVTLNSALHLPVA